MSDDRYRQGWEDGINFSLTMLTLASMAACKTSDDVAIITKKEDDVAISEAVKVVVGEVGDAIRNMVRDPSLMKSFQEVQQLAASMPTDPKVIN